MRAGSQHFYSCLFAPIPRSHVRWWALAIATALLAAQVLFWFVQVRPWYFPNGDEFPLLVHSTRVFHAHPSEWVLRGFADYFRPYPDLAIVGSEFLRPLDNACFYLTSFVAGQHWAAYLLMNYVLAAGVVAVTFSLAAGLLRLPLWVVGLVTLGAAASPAYNYQFFYRPSFAFDYLAALFSLLCIAPLVRQRWLPAWCFVLLAVLSKETGYYSAACACVFALFWYRSEGPARRWLLAGSYLLPLAIMHALRSHAFHRTTGVYVLHGVTPRGLLRNLIVGATNWPYRLPGEQHIFALSASNLASLLLSVALWSLLAYVAISLWRQRALAQRQADTAPRIALLLFLLGSCCFPVLLVLPVRFGASTFPLLLLCLAAVLPTVRVSAWTWRVAVVSLLAVVAANVWILPASFRGPVLQEQRDSWALARDLIDRLNRDDHAVRFLVGDSTAGFATPEDVQHFAGSSGRVFPVIGFQKGSCSDPASIAVTPDPGGANFRLAAPCGGMFQLVWTERPTGDSGQTLRRATNAAQVTYSADSLSIVPDSYGWKDVAVDLRPATRSYIVLAPDLKARHYVEIAKAP